MPITQAESGLSTDQYNILSTMIEDGIFDIFLYQWLPDLVTGTTGVTGYNMFDAVQHDDTIYRVTPWTMKTLTETIDDFDAPSGVTTGIPPSMISDTDLYIFFATATGISLSTYDGVTFSSWNEIVTDSTIAYLSATSSDTVHFITYDSASQNYNFQVAVFDGSWTVTESNVFWGYHITSFSAERSGNRDTLLFTTDAPGVISTNVVGTVVDKKVIPAGGLFGITYKYSSWSDHYEVDRVDQWSTFRYRSRVNVSHIDDTLWMTCYSSEGTIDNPITGYRIYNSKDGRHWSRGELFPLSDTTSEGLIVLAVDDMLYALTYYQIYSAKRTLWFDSPHEDTIFRLTPYITTIDVSRQDIQQINVTVDNKDDWMLNSIADGFHSLALKLQTGFVSGTGTVMVDTGIFEVDTIEPSQDKPKTLISITARDRFSWMTDKSQSEQFLNWNPQSVGIDDYVDSTGTGYGGLTHTATVKGSYKAFNGSLQLDTSNEEGIAFSTWLYDDWNGSIEFMFELSQLANSEYAGAIFRAPDKDNGFLYIYNQSDDKLKLIQRVEGVDTILYASSAKGWSGAIDDYDLRVDFRYSNVKLYYSTDSSSVGINWVLEADLVVDGQDPIVDATLVPLMQSGYVGTIGKGFSDQDTSIPSPDPIGSGDIPYPPYVPPDDLFPPPNTIPAVTGQIPLNGIAISQSDAKAHFATLFDQGTNTITWSDRSTGKTGIGGTGYSDPFHYNTFFNFNNVGVEKLSNQNSAGSYSWSNPLDNVDLYNNGSDFTQQAHGSHLVRDWGMAIAVSGNYARTVNGWQTNSQHIDTLVSFWICGHESNHLWAVRSVGGGAFDILHSIDGGATFTVISTIPDFRVHGGASSFVNIYIPYQRGFGSSGNNLDDSNLQILIGISSQFGGSSGAGLFRVTAGQLAAHPAGALDVAVLVDTLASYWSYSNAFGVTAHTWVTDRLLWGSYQGVSDAYAVISDDGGTTQSAPMNLGFGAGSVGDSVGFNGWPMSYGVWVFFTPKGLRITFDNGLTWWGNSPASWSTNACSYFELSLVGLI